MQIPILLYAVYDMYSFLIILDVWDRPYQTWNPKNDLVVFMFGNDLSAMVIHNKSVFPSLSSLSLQQLKV